MRNATTNDELLSADLAAKTLPEPTAAAIEDRDGFRFASIRIGKIGGANVFQWELIGGSGFTTGLRFRRPWIETAAHKRAGADEMEWPEATQ